METGIIRDGQTIKCTLAYYTKIAQARRHRRISKQVGDGTDGTSRVGQVGGRNRQNEEQEREAEPKGRNEGKGNKRGK